MKLLKFEAFNFGSYRHIQMDLSSVGLGLIYGKTGCGKSTLMDAVCWALFGSTAKDGKVDDIRCWQTMDGEGTSIDLHVDVAGKEIVIHRWRGTGSELFWAEKDNGEVVIHRGKDVGETQRLLNERLGVDAELYAMAAYFHEFSPTASFFTAKSKDRRAIFERVASLVLPVRLAEAASDERKASKLKLQGLEKDLAKATGRVETYQKSVKDAENQSEVWELNHAAQVKSLEARAFNFNEIKSARLSELKRKIYLWNEDTAKETDSLVQDIEAAISDCQVIEAELSVVTQDSYCPTCKQVTGEGRKRLDRQKELTLSLKYKKSSIDSLSRALGEKVSEVNPYEADYLHEQNSENHYSDFAEKEKATPNPFNFQAQQMKGHLALEEASLKLTAQRVTALQARISSLTQLYDMSFDLRGLMLKSSVKDIESETNRVLDRYFDAEIRVGFTLKGSDDLEVSIQKSGYDCPYKQLSKGQRGLLKLAFGVAVMKAAANRAGVHFDNLWFDEALDGLDADLKVKAFGLFEELSCNYGSVFLIEHSSEFQTLFSKKYRVTMESDFSEVEILE